MESESEVLHEVHESKTRGSCSIITQCRLKTFLKLPFIILQSLVEQDLNGRSLCTHWSFASEPEPSDTNV